MRHRFRLTAAAAVLVSITLPAHALQLAPAAAGGESGITLVRDGCGPFGHRSHYGYCKENGDGEGYDGGFAPRGYGYGHGPAFFGEGYRERRCFIRETYDGPVRICR